MKISLMTIILAALLISFTRDVQAQEYGSGNYDQYWDGTEYQSYPKQYDPYYELHVLHYQLYLPQYQYCCVAGGIVVPRTHRSATAGQITPANYQAKVGGSIQYAQIFKIRSLRKKI